MKFRHRIYLLLPNWLDAGIQRSFAALRQLRSRGMLLERFVGQCGESSEPIEVLTTGRTTTVDYVLRRLLTDRMDCVERRRLPAKSVGHVLLEYPDADLIIARSSGRDRADGFGVWRIPDSVVSIIDLDPAIAEIKSNHGNADSLRRIKKHRLSASVSHDRKELGDFVQDAYVPHIRSRFGDLARPHSELTVARAFRSGGLLWVLQDGVRLAGLVFSITGDTICSRIAAPVSNTELAVRAHAVSATKKFLIDYAIENGYRRLDLGRSRPQLLDGVLRHKKRWGARLENAPAEHAEFHMSWRAFTPAIAQWLRTTPLVVRENGGLTGLTALAENESSEACHHRLSRLWSPGLERIIVLNDTGRNLAIDEIEGTRVTWRTP